MNPVPDYNDSSVVNDPAFVGLVWHPTEYLRFVERDVPSPAGGSDKRRILQQLWVIRVLNKPGHAVQVHGSGSAAEWRDIPLEMEET